MTTYPVKKILMTLTLFLGIAGCSSGPKVQEFAATANATDELQSFNSDMSAAREAQVDVLSPSAYRSADNALKSATSYQQKGKDAKDVLHQISVGRAQLELANKFAALSRTNLEAVVAARQDAIKAGAPKLFSEAFGDADDHLRSVTSDIEKNDLGDVAENRGKLQKEYMDVEIKSINQVNLAGPRATIALAQKEGAKEFAQQTLAIAQKNVADTEAFIVANRHQSDAIKSRSAAATLAANHALKITRASKSGKNVSSEQAALALESEQDKTQAKRDELSAEQTNSKELAAEAGALRSADALNQSFEAARKSFTKSEAEVYRQGDKLVIRLRSLEFPANKSVLRGTNFPLLAKVAKVVKGFEGSTVVIEGHTDSDGGKESNLKLSTERAQAISDYLTSNEAVSEGKISVAGYGYERPLATNKTVKGKAQNRRVDVIISPVTMSE